MKSILPLIFLILSSVFVSGQESLPTPDGELRHEMTPAERLRAGEIGRGFVETDPPSSPVRNIAEFERMQGALVRYPFGIPIALIKEMAEDVTVTTIVASASQKSTVLNQYVSNGVDTSHCDFLIAPTNSYWTRDFGPWFECDSAGQIGIVDFPYNRPRPLDDEIPKLVATMIGVPCYGMNVISTGGNYMCDGYGIGSSTDLVYVENPSQTPAQVDEKMFNYLGITDFQVVPDPNISSTIDHIDCWGKFLTPDRILIRKTLQTDPEYAALEQAAAYWASQTCSFGYPYKVFRVMTPQDQPYTNSVILNNKVLVPFMGSAWDDSARAVYQAAMPGYEILGFIGAPSTPWLSTDALHCRVIGIADIGMLRITHTPLHGDQPSEVPALIEARITASSQQPLIADSLLIYYRVNGGPYLTAILQPAAGDTFTGHIPPQAAGSLVEYFLSAADLSGRHETMPLVGPADPYKYTTVATNLTAVPDTLWFLTASDCLNGKITQLTNYTASPLMLNFVQQNGSTFPMWMVDSMSVATLPALVQPGGSVAVKVVVALPLLLQPGILFDKDSLAFTTPEGTQYVIIMVNHDVMQNVPALNKNLFLENPSPNPFNEMTEISCFMERPGRLMAEVYDLHGIPVRSWPETNLPAGKFVFPWDGTGDDGRRLPPGLYLLKVTDGKSTETTRLILLP